VSIATIKPPDQISLGQIQSVINPNEGLTTEVVIERLGVEYSRRNQMAVAKALRSLGYEHTRVSISGQQRWVYWQRPSLAEQANCSNSHSPGDAQQTPADPPQP
jgi:hypothetical protein